MKDKDDITLGDTTNKEGEDHAAKPSITQSDATVSEAAQPPTQRDSTGRFVPGHERLGGRETGTKNKLDHHTKVMLKALVDHGLEDAMDVYDRIKAKQPRAALTILSRFAEYAVPKLARTEVVGEDGGPLIIEKRIHDSSDKDKE